MTERNSSTSGRENTPPQVPVDSGRAQVGRECMAAMISGVILFVSMWAFVSTFSAGREPFATTDARKEAYERQKDLLVIAVGLLGTVTGYYLGRVPAELRAQSAQNLLSGATTAATQATRDKEQVRAEARAAADAALRALQSQAPAPRGDARSGAGAPSEMFPASGGADSARQILETFLRRV